MNSQPKVRIALVEDYRTHREELEDLLRAEGFDAHGVESGEALTALLQRKGSFDLVVLDLNLPGEDGLSIARRLQSTSPATRIIMLSGRVKGSDKIQGYEAGADVYLTKPQRPKELLAVIWALTRRMVSVEEPKHGCSWRLSLTQSSIESPEGDVIPLTRSEASLVHMFHLAPNHTLPLTVLLEHFDLPATTVGKNLLSVRMSRLRFKIKPHTAGISSIKAHRHEGYQLLIEIQIF